MAYIYGSGAAAGAFGGLIAFGIQSAHIAFAKWRLLFIVEGLPSVIMGLVAMIVFPGRPAETTMLNDDERELQLRRQRRGLKPAVRRAVNMSHVKAALKDWKLYMGSVMYFGGNCAQAANTAFLPTIIKTFGYNDANSQLLTVPPYAVCAVVLVSTSYFSDRLQSRGIPVSCAAALGGIGNLLLLTVPDNNRVRYFATFCITTSSLTNFGLGMAWFAHNMGSESKTAAGLPLLIALGQFGSVVGSHIFLKTDGPRYIKGFAISCALEFLAAACGIILTIYYRMENKRRDREYGVPEPHAEVDTSVLADEAPMFRYVV